MSLFSGCYWLSWFMCKHCKNIFIYVLWTPTVWFCPDMVTNNTPSFQNNRWMTSWERRATMRVRAEGRRRPLMRRWMRKMRSSSLELRRQQEECSALRRPVWRKVFRHRAVRPVCPLMCRGEKQTFLGFCPSVTTGLSVRNMQVRRLVKLYSVHLIVFF